MRLLLQLLGESGHPGVDIAKVLGEGLHLLCKREALA